MIRISFIPIPLLLGLGFIALLLPFVWLWKRRWWYLLVFAVFGFYLLLVVGLTIFPIPLPLSGESRFPASEILSRVNLVPFTYGRSARFPFLLRREMMANILMTIPFGFLFPLLIRVKPWRFLWLAVLIGLVIETTQLALSLFLGVSYRVTDINDVLLNAGGALIGYTTYIILRWLMRMSTRLAHRDVQ